MADQEKYAGFYPDRNPYRLAAIIHHDKPGPQKRFGGHWSDWGTITVHFARVYDNGPTHNITFGHDKDGDLDALVIRAQYNVKPDSYDSPLSRVYGWGVYYQDCYSVELDRATAMVKRLTRINARMAKLEQQYGRPATFGAYVLRICEIVGARLWADSSADGWSWEFPYWQQVNCDSMVWVIDNMRPREADERAESVA